MVRLLSLVSWHRICKPIPNIVSDILHKQGVEIVDIVDKRHPIDLQSHM